MLGNPEYHLSVAFSLPWLNLVLTWVLYSPQWWRTVLPGVKASSLWLPRVCEDALGMRRTVVVEGSSAVLRELSSAGLHVS